MQAVKPKPLPPPIEAIAPEPVSEPTPAVKKAEQTPVPTVVEDTTPARKVADAPAIIKDSPALNSATKKEEDVDTEQVVEDEDKTETSAKAKTASTVNPKAQGWNCDSKNKADDWNCQLVGADPKGRARPIKAVADNSYRISLLDPAFNEEEEQNFGTLVSRMKRYPGNLCNP